MKAKRQREREREVKGWTGGGWEGGETGEREGGSECVEGVCVSNEEREERGEGGREGERVGG